MIVHILLVYFSIPGTIKIITQPLTESYERSSTKTAALNRIANNKTVDVSYLPYFYFLVLLSPDDSFHSANIYTPEQYQQT